MKNNTIILIKNNRISTKTGIKKQTFKAIFLFLPTLLFRNITFTVYGLLKTINYLKIIFIHTKVIVQIHEFGYPNSRIWTSTGCKVTVSTPYLSTSITNQTSNQKTNALLFITMLLSMYRLLKYPMQ